MKIDTDFRPSSNISTFGVDDLDVGNIYHPIDDSDVRVIVFDSISLFIDKDGVEEFEPGSWRNDKFVLAPPGDKVTISFIQE